MNSLAYLSVASAICVTGCISANPVITAPELEQIEENAELYNKTSINIASNELILNLLRARDHSPRAYTSISDVSMNPGGDFKRSLEAGGLGRGAAWTGFTGTVSATNNDKLSYTLANASKSDGKNFADQRFDAETFNEFWNQTWPRAMLLRIFFHESALQIVQGGNAAESLADYYGLGLEPVDSKMSDADLELRNVGQEPFYVMSDNGHLSYCLNALEACIESTESASEPTSSGQDSGSEASLNDVKVNVAVSLQDQAKASTANPDYLWNPPLTEAFGEPIKGIRVSNDFLRPRGLVDDLLYHEVNAPEQDKTTSTYHLPNRYKLLYCAAHTEKNIVTRVESDLGVTGAMASAAKYRPVSVFKCSDTLSDVDQMLAQPYFLVVDSTGKESIYQPKLSSFDNAIYLLGRSMRAGLESTFATETSFCSPFIVADKKDCDKGERLFQIYSEQQAESAKFNDCAAAFVAEVTYRGETYRAGLPEPNDNDDEVCTETAMTSTLIILLSKIEEYSIQRPEIRTQLLLTQ